MLSDTHYLKLNVWLFKNDKFALLLVIMSQNCIFHVKMEDPYQSQRWISDPLRGGGPGLTPTHPRRSAATGEMIPPFSSVFQQPKELNAPKNTKKKLLLEKPSHQFDKTNRTTTVNVIYRLTSDKRDLYVLNEKRFLVIFLIGLIERGRNWRDYWISIER